jgi:HPt (histidine-containing phosphotransfer) domain-containing protein
MHQAADAELHDQVASLAHRLKPSVRAMGATRMSEHLLKLEQAAEEKCGEAIHRQLEHLTPILVRLECEIAALA